ncbi:unnamed protein product [Sphenostylis stenocarpa]|uniref:Uncharacterized protein n=1 Tax=Sphenostylis stenocarpa TaxID=92480 RepID=A0AA86SSH5_9FABA|nr:unnamed protein product [Sphenostylis stenocarpa]
MATKRKRVKYEPFEFRFRRGKEKHYNHDARANIAKVLFTQSNSHHALNHPPSSSSGEITKRINARNSAKRHSYEHISYNLNHHMHYRVQIVKFSLKHAQMFLSHSICRYHSWNSGILEHA